MPTKCWIFNKIGSSTHIFIRKPFRKFAPYEFYTSLLRVISQHLKMSLWKRHITRVWYICTLKYMNEIFQQLTIFLRLRKVIWLLQLITNYENQKNNDLEEIGLVTPTPDVVIPNGWRDREEAPGVLPSQGWSNVHFIDWFPMIVHKQKWF